MHRLFTFTAWCITCAVPFSEIEGACSSRRSSRCCGEAVPTLLLAVHYTRSQDSLKMLLLLTAMHATVDFLWIGKTW